MDIPKVTSILNDYNLETFSSVSLGAVFAETLTLIAII